MNNPENGWSDWERKLNNRTAIRRAHTVSAARMRRWIFFWLEIVLFLGAVAATVSYAAGNLIVPGYLAALTIICALMSFCAGYFIGATKK